MGLEIAVPSFEKESVATQALQVAVDALVHRLAGLRADRSGPDREQVIRTYRETRLNIRDTAITEHPEWADVISTIVDSTAPSAEWFILATHVVCKYKHHAEVLKIFWNAVRNVHSIGFEDSHTAVIAQACVFQIFENLGLEPRLPTPEQDAHEKTDMFVKGRRVQVKSRATTVLSDIEISEIDQIINVRLNNEAADPITAIPSVQMMRDASPKIDSILNKRT